MKRIIFAIIAIIFLIGCIQIEKTYPINFNSQYRNIYTDIYNYTMWLNCSTYNSYIEFNGDGFIFINESQYPVDVRLSYYDYNLTYTNYTLLLNLYSYKIDWDYFDVYVLCNNELIEIDLIN
jgi:hypothetical protein